jgi:hypothetical protein
LRQFYFNVKVKIKSKFGFPLVRNQFSKKLIRTLSNDLINHPNLLFNSFLDLQKSKVNKFSLSNCSSKNFDSNLIIRQIFFKNAFKKLYLPINFKYRTKFMFSKILNLRFNMKKGFSPFFLFRFFIFNLRVLLLQFFNQLKFVLSEKKEKEVQAFFSSSEVRYYLSLLKNKIFKLYYIFFPKNLLSSFFLKKLFREVLIFSPKLLFSFSSSKFQFDKGFYLNSKHLFQKYFFFF